MRIAIIGLILVGMLGWAFYNTYTEQVADSPEQMVIDEEIEEINRNPGSIPQVGEKAANFTLQTLDGDTLSLSDFEGEKVFLNFWAAWCPPCRAEMPDMQNMYEDHDIAILAVNLLETEPGIGQVEQFVEDFELTFPVLLDDKTEVADKYGVQPIPMSYLIDTEGTIQYVSMGPMTYDMMVNEMNKLD